MQPFRSVTAQLDYNSPVTGTCEVITYDSAHLNVFAAEVSYCQPHWHDAPELIYVLSGAIVLTVNQQEVLLKQGEFAYIGADMIHALAQHNASCAVLTWQFSPTLFDQLHPPSSGFMHIAATNKGLQQTALQLLESLLVDNPAYFILQSHIYAVLAQLESLAVLRPVHTAERTVVMGDSRDEQVIRQSIAYINDTYTTPITVADLADRAFLSYSHFSRLFKKISGYSPSDYLGMVRLNHAKPLLKNMQIPITDIAELAGFGEHRAMLAAFKKYCNMTPTEYRKQYYADFNWRADDERITPTANKPIALSVAFNRMRDSR